MQNIREDVGQDKRTECCFHLFVIFISTCSNLHKQQHGIYSGFHPDFELDCSGQFGFNMNIFNLFKLSTHWSRVIMWSGYWSLIGLNMNISSMFWDDLPTKNRTQLWIFLRRTIVLNIIRIQSYLYWPLLAWMNIFVNLTFCLKCSLRWWYCHVKPSDLTIYLFFSIFFSLQNIPLSISWIDTLWR